RSDFGPAGDDTRRPRALLFPVPDPLPPRRGKQGKRRLLFTSWDLRVPLAVSGGLYVLAARQPRKDGKTRTIACVGARAVDLRIKGGKSHPRHRHAAAVCRVREAARPEAKPETRNPKPDPTMSNQELLAKIGQSGEETEF